MDQFRFDNLYTNGHNMKPKQIGRYEIKEVCGEGSFGKVYRGIEAVTLEEVALKFISRK